MCSMSGEEVKEKKLLNEQEAFALLERYGIRVPKQSIVHSAEEAVVSAEAIGYPVVMKVVSSDILHKTDIGGVLLNLANHEEVRAAYEEICTNVSRKMPEAHIEGISVNEMLGQGTECIIGLTRDPVFGAVIMFGLGGIFAEVLKDVSFRLLPLTEKEACDMIRETKGSSLLAGVRGQSPKDQAALVEALLGVSKMAEDLPELEELDINPCIVYTKGLVAADVKIII